MQCREFNGIMPHVHHRWIAEILNMQINEKLDGPDLIDNNKIIEVKFSLINNKGNYPQAWTVIEEQLDYPETYNKKGYWGLGTYELDRDIKEIKTKDHQELEKMVLRRNLYIVEWEWILHFAPSKTSGETKSSKWEYTFRYPKLKDIPEIIESTSVDKGLVHLTKGVSLEDFFII